MRIEKDTPLNELHLSKDIAELEKDIAYVWEPPDIYNDVMKDNVWLVYGRKGSGKSHLVDYLGTDKKREAGKDAVIVIRSREDNLFFSVMFAISKEKTTDERVLLENVAASVEFVIVTLLMRRCIDVQGFLTPTSDRGVIYNFLVANGLHEGSFLNQLVSVLGRITGGEIKIVENLAQLLADNPTTKGFADAKNALWRQLKEGRRSFVICIDDIDEIGFSYSHSDRIFVNALIVVMLRLNLEFARSGHPLRVLLTSPSELFFHSTLWGDDWVETKSRCLRWTHHEGVQRIVNKRIARELNIRKTNPRTKEDIYSDATDQTWAKVFPMTVLNKLGKPEPSLIYILRHTFYTPRHVLDICDKIIRHLGEKGHTLASAAKLDQYEWSLVFQAEIEEYTCNVVRSFLKQYGHIYEGIDDVLRAFVGKPTIWSRAALSSFVQKETLKLSRRENRKVYSGDSLVDTLQHLGFLGLGCKDLVPVGMTMPFNLRFAFLERLPTSRPWEIAVVTPIFYDSYGLRPPDNTVVVPHEKLTLSHSAWQQVMQNDK